MSSRKVCVVCGGVKPVARNYGVLTCNGCKCFFRRAVIGNMVLTPCSVRNGKCIVENCKACRLHNCINKGMDECYIKANKKTGGNRRLIKQTKKVQRKTTKADAAYFIKKSLSNRKADTKKRTNISCDSIIADVVADTVNDNQLNSKLYKIDNVPTDNVDVIAITENISQSKKDQNKILQTNLQELHKAIKDCQEHEKKIVEFEKFLEEYQIRENLRNKQIQELQEKLEETRKIRDERTIELTQLDKLRKELQEGILQIQKELQKISLETAANEVQFCPSWTSRNPISNLPQSLQNKIDTNKRGKYALRSQLYK